jgi:hypothetical protein
MSSQCLFSSRILELHDGVFVRSATGQFQGTNARTCCAGLMLSKIVPVVIDEYEKSAEQIFNDQKPRIDLS